jgi:hypothetical protein
LGDDDYSFIPGFISLFSTKVKNYYLKLLIMSGEKYERPEGSPMWVESVEDEYLVCEALGYDAKDLVLSSKRNCEIFVNTKRRSLPPQAGKKLIPVQYMMYCKRTN